MATESCMERKKNSHEMKVSQVHAKCVFFSSSIHIELQNWFVVTDF